MLFQIFGLRRAQAAQPSPAIPHYQSSNSCPPYPPQPYCPPLPTAHFGCPLTAAIPTLGAPTGKHDESARLAACFSNRLNQGQGFSTVVDYLYTDASYRFAERKQFSLHYNKETPELSEIKNGKHVATQFELLFYADGKIYNAKGEVQGRFLFDGPPSVGQDKSPILYSRGSLERQGSCNREDYDPARMTLGGRKVFIVSAPPPGTSAVFRPVNGTEIESRAGGTGLILHATKVVGHEIEWMCESKAKALRAAQVSAIHEQILKLKLQPDKTGFLTLPDGTRVGTDQGCYSVIRDTVLAAKHPLRCAETVFGRTGQTEREVLGVIPVPVPETAPKPQEIKPVPPKVEELRDPAPKPLPIPKKEKALTDADSDPRKLALHQPEKPEYKKLHSDEIRMHQLRLLQLTEACVAALEIWCKSPKVEVPSEVLIGTGTSLQNPKQFADLLESSCTKSLRSLEKALRQAPHAELRELGESTSIRFSTVVRRLEETEEKFRKMPEETSKDEVEKVLAELRGDVHSLTGKFSSEFGFGVYSSSKVLGCSGPENLKELITRGFIPKELAPKHVNDRARIIAEFLKQYFLRKED